MDYKHYIKDATRTESQIEAVNSSPKALMEALTIFIKAGEVLDLYKRQIYYGKDFEDSQIAPLMAEIHALSGESVDRAREDIAVNPRIFHAAMGFATEAGEVMEAMEANMRGEELDTVNLGEEIGDINWYTAIALDETGLELDSILERNIAKLRARFPEKFTEHHAANRDLDTERQILEGKD